MPCPDCSPTSSALPRLKTCKLLSRVRSNRAPVASERTELIELISQAEKDLISYEETIARLQAKIITLKSEKSSLNRQVHLAKSLMAPIRHLPPELLLEIFIAHGVRNILRSHSRLVWTSEGPRSIPGFKVASVCSHWRSIAKNTTALWNDIRVEIDDGHTKYDSFLPALTKRLLALSKESFLSISIDIGSSPPVPDSIISMLALLCAQANRWQHLEGFLEASALLPGMPTIDALASMKGHLDNLHTFQLLGPPEHCGRWVEEAPRLHTLSFFQLSDRRHTQITGPWDQIVNFTAKASCVPRIAEFLQKMPNLLSLYIVYFDEKFEDSDDEDSDDNVIQRVSHSNLKSLEIIILDDDEEQMDTFFASLTLPRLQSLCIAFQEDYLTNQNNHKWSSVNLPSMISRSSALITSFSLHKVWMETSHLISLLQIMPTLNSLFLSESIYGFEASDVNPMINDQLLLKMHAHYKNQQPILTCLTSLNLEVDPLASFGCPTFVDMIHSRWHPAYVDEVACIRTVKLVARDFTIVPDTVDSLMVLQKRGLDITIEDENGAVISE